MGVELIVAIVAMVLALACYSVGVWGEKVAGRLQVRHLVFFWIGFVCDTTGTTVMSEIAGGFTLSVHAVTGVVALVLMAVHAVWASVVFARSRAAELAGFHRFSLFVWSLWLVPFAIGMVMAMAG